MQVTTLENGTLHIEAEGCIVNIKEGLFDKMKKCTNVAIIPDDRYQGEKIWKVKGHSYNRVIQTEEVFSPKVRMKGEKK